jgi:hypothetical protein
LQTVKRIIEVAALASRPNGECTSKFLRTPGKLSTELGQRAGLGFYFHSGGTYREQ